MKNQASERQKRRQQKIQKRRIVNATVLAVIVILAASVCFALFSPNFDIQNVVCEGNAHITDDVLIKTASVQIGDNIFLSSFSAARERVEALDYVLKAEIKRVLPSTVCISVTEDKPSAYFAVGSNLVLTDLGGNVIDVISSSDEADEIINTKITSDEELSPEATPQAEEKEDEEYNPIWGYDDDGDPIYKVNGGHYEFDEDGNRFFVDDSAPTATPEDMPTATPSKYLAKSGELNFDELPVTGGGRIIYSAPIVYGADLKEFELGKKVKSNDETKLSTIMSAIKSLYNVDMLNRTTKIDTENLADVKITIEDRLEIWFGSFDDFEYKSSFAASVINENLSKYEHAIMDFRDSKLYVRSADTTSPKVKTTPTPRPTEDVKNTNDSDNDEDDVDDVDNVDDDEEGSEDTDE